MDIKETPDHEFVDIHIERRRFLWIVGIVLVGCIALIVMTAEKVRELAGRVVAPVEYIPPKAEPDMPLIAIIKGYNAATSTAFDKFLDDGDHRAHFDKLQHFLDINGVGDVVPPFELLRQGTDWQDVDEPPFAVPPEENWETMVDTLKVLQDYIIPAIGPVTVLSGWRTAAYNAKAGGARTSKHMHFCGLDMIPQDDYTRKQLLPKLRRIHKKYGRQWNMGLGIYSGVRFHVDTCGYRRW